MVVVVVVVVVARQYLLMLLVEGGDGSGCGGNGCSKTVSFNAVGGGWRE